MKALTHTRTRPGALTKHALGSCELPQPVSLASTPVPEPRAQRQQAASHGGKRPRRGCALTETANTESSNRTEAGPLTAQAAAVRRLGSCFSLRPFDTPAGGDGRHQLGPLLLFLGPEDLNAAPETKHRPKSTRWPQSTIRGRLYLHTASSSFKFQQELTLAPCLTLGNTCAAVLLK